MADVLDCRGMKCPQPVLKVAIKARTVRVGTALEVHADCSSFDADVRKWCTDNGRVLISVVDRGGFKVATIQF